MRACRLHQGKNAESYNTNELNGFMSSVPHLEMSKLVLNSFNILSSSGILGAYEVDKEGKKGKERKRDSVIPKH